MSSCPEKTDVFLSPCSDFTPVFDAVLPEDHSHTEQLSSAELWPVFKPQVMKSSNILQNQMRNLFFSQLLNCLTTLVLLLKASLGCFAYIFK